ncbi:neck protein [Paraglaciecola Antarctic GD virus 1]|nr:neck protein [Paraglaciecola Antarctic GD virus 1]
MAFNVKTGLDLKDHILRRLGAPVINIEITEEQIYDCINRAIELFVEYHYDGVDKTYIVRKLSAEEAALGLICFEEPILGISKVESTSNAILEQYNGSSVITDWIFNLAGSGTNTGRSHAYGGGSGVGTQFDMISWQLMNANLETIKNMVSPSANYHYNGMNRQLKLFDSFKENEIVFIECYVESAVFVSSLAGATGEDLVNFVGGSGGTYNTLDVTTGGVGKDQLQNVYNVRWVKDASTAYTKHLWGSILKKYGNQQLPGGLTVDGQTIFDEATAELAELRQELYDLEEPLGVMMG